MVDLTPPDFLFDPVANRDNATIIVKSEAGVTFDAQGFPVISAFNVELRARIFSDSAKGQDVFPPGTDLQGELLRGRLNNPKLFPSVVKDLTIVQLLFDDGRKGTARLHFNTQNPLVGNPSGSVLGQKFWLLFREEN